MRKKESKYQKELIRRITSHFPGSIVIKNDPYLCQGIPDIIILYRDRWAMLEVKRAINAKRQPNQTYWVDFFDQMGFAFVIYPENEQLVFNFLELYFRV